jgi:hypothetical protein
MRLFHLILAVFFAALILAVARDQVGRVALVVFFTGLSEFIFGTIAVMSLFQTVAAIGHARRLGEYMHALGATALVLLLATATMNGVLWFGWWILDIVLA